ncbi:hypothetical protein QUB61_13135 [Microcoleus sp. C2D2]
MAFGCYARILNPCCLCLLFNIGMGGTNGELSNLPRLLAKPHLPLEQKYQLPEQHRQFTVLMALPKVGDCF